MNPTFASLSLAHLRTLDHLLQLKNLSHAAERLGVSQDEVLRRLARGVGDSGAATCPASAVDSARICDPKTHRFYLGGGRS